MKINCYDSGINCNIDRFNDRTAESISIVAAAAAATAVVG